MHTNKHIRQIALPQVGEKGQQQLKEASVLVIGAGGLGNALLPYLASSGIGTIGVIDGDTIMNNNLHRQILFSDNDIDLLKAHVASKKLKSQFPETNIIAYSEFLTADNVMPLFKDYHIIVDATDTIEIRYLINDACVLLDKPFVHASVYRFQFQIAVFNTNGSGTYRCLYPNPPKTVQSCAEAGVMPTTVAIAGLYQANEIIKFILGIGELLTNRVLLIDTLSNQQNIFTYTKKEFGFITHSFFDECYKKRKEIKLISYNEIIKQDVQLLDVREPNEQPFLRHSKIINIPLDKLESQINMINEKLPVYLFCKSGKRSALAYKVLKKIAFENVYCLKENADQLNKLI